ncbi:MAG TPA: hypothetical protein VI895_13030 [Bdellovibrionota bacterium]|nr:hypothetical protein [Bdellovibrionota bacterium]
MNPVRNFACGVLLLLIAGCLSCGDDHNPHFLPAYAYYYSSPTPSVRAVSYPSHYGYSAYVPVQSYSYGYYDYCYPYYGNPYYGASLSAYVSCRQGYSAVYDFTCYYPAAIGYYASASRYVDLAFLDLSRSDWRSLDEHVRLAQNALPAGHHSLGKLEQIRQNSSYVSVDPKSVANSLVEVQGDWSTKLARTAVAKK